MMDPCSFLGSGSDVPISTTAVILHVASTRILIGTAAVAEYEDVLVML